VEEFNRRGLNPYDFAGKFTTFYISWTKHRLRDEHPNTSPKIGPSRRRCIYSDADASMSAIAPFIQRPWIFINEDPWMWSNMRSSQLKMDLDQRRCIDIGEGAFI